MDEPVRVLIADDHAPTRRQIRLALESHGFSVCAEAANGDTAVKAALHHAPQVCLIDIGMPTSGIVAAQDISDALPATTVVMLTASDDTQDLFAALRAGAAGYLLKGGDLARLPDALEGVLRGEAAMPRTLTSRIIAEFQHRERRLPARLRARGQTLTSKEWEVLAMLREQLSTQEIADRLVVAPVTVRTHVSSILRKLRVTSRRELLHLLGED